MSTKTMRYAVVLHSGCGYKGDMQFAGGLESTGLSTKAQDDRVLKLGGVTFDGYSECEDFCDWAMYTASDAQGLYPQCRKVGRFSHKLVDGLQIFMPRQGVVEAFLAHPHDKLPTAMLS